jgi:PTH1 family peptidyl-tRNA hydrolase
MNLSGSAIESLTNKFNLSESELVVIHDEIAFEVGVFKLKTNGSNGGHNGLKSIINYYGSNFKRIRIGVGHPNKLNVSLSQ